MSDAMLSCRPDYLLYPEKNTKFERAEHIRLLNDKGQRLALLQDWTNTLKNKKVIVTDTMLWSIDSNELQKALKFLSTIKNISFFEPIWIQKLVADKNNLNAFLELNLTPGAQIKWIPITIAQYQESVEIIKQIKEKFPHVDAGTLVIKIFYADHWLNNDKNQAYEDFVQIKQCIINAKENKIKIEIQDLKSRLDSPYFEIYENLHRWTADYFNLSWLEYITKIYGNGLLYSVDLWNHPEKWNDTFRNLLRQTRQDSTFLLTQWGSRKMSTNDIPWLRWEKEFEYGL